MRISIDTGKNDANYRPYKSKKVAALLVLLFGPLGMIYTTIPGAIVMTIAYGAAITAYVANDYAVGYVLLPLFVLAICFAWTIMASSKINHRLDMTSW